MRDKKATSVVIHVDEDGVFRVRLYGRTWEDQAQANDLFQRIAHLVREIDRTLKNPERGTKH
jgi:hypothetical protein